MRKDWVIPVSLLAVGIAFLVGSLAWAVVSGIAVPDQDPTPAMQAHARFHYRIANGLMSGGLLFVLGSVLSFSILIVHRLRTSRRDDATVK